jgi:uncharacterized membrane protein YfcA
MATSPLGSLLPLLPLGLVAGLLSGLLGIGGGLIFSPLLLLVGLPPHQALATSTLAIVPTTLAGCWAQGRSGSVPWRGGLAIASTAALAGSLFSRLGLGLPGWQLLALQALMYLLLTLTITPRSRLATGEDSRALPLAALALVGSLAGVASGLLGVGGGLVMVPLMVRALQVPIRLAIRFSTLAVLASASTASVGFLGDGRADPAIALVLGGTAAVAAQWSGARLNRISEDRLAWLLRSVTLVLLIDSSRRALTLALGG